MSSNSFIWVTEDGDLSTADWGSEAAWPAAALACVCRLHMVAVRLAAQVSDEKRIRGVVCEMHYTN